MNNGNKPASPYLDVDYDGEGNIEEYSKNFGLTKREHFAAMAMQGILSNSRTIDNDDDHSEWVAKRSVGQADALLKALEAKAVIDE